MYFSYIEAGCIGIRQRDDTNPDSISLINVLTEIEQNAMVLTKERFVDLLSWMPGHPFFEDPGNKDDKVDQVLQAQMDVDIAEAIEQAREYIKKS